MVEYLGQIHQDKFILNILKGKRDGGFLEIGSNHPININNTFLLESCFNWRGIMVEYEASFLPLYRQHRPNSIHIISDATVVDYKSLFENNNFPKNIDYLQIDLEASNGSTIKTLEKLDSEILDDYKFATITFEHDIYVCNNFNTRIKSREIFNKRGYICVFEDVNDSNSPYEDWWVHPDLVDMNYVNEVISKNSNKYYEHSLTGKTINWKTIEY